MNNAYFKAILLAFALFTGFISWAQPQVPDRPYPQRLVNDFAGLLNTDERNRLEKELVVYNDSTSNQVAIITLPNLGDYPIEDWALEIGRKWGVGRKSKNNGVVIIVALQPRKMNISPGYGLEGALTDVMCKRIITNEMTPSFKVGQYYEGFSKAVKAIRVAAKGEYVNEERGQEGSSNGALWVFIIIFIIIIVIFLIVANSKNKATYYGPRQKRHYDNGGGGWIMWGGGGSDWGSGSSSNDSGGFDGFGGGDFGGGGASGDW